MAGATVDATTGATPGVSAACKELGMASLSDVIADMGIKPPGQAQGNASRPTIIALGAKLI